ncbi:MAG TPA: S49 family peptidase, partial [Candidatus Eisenbacteria bacterium]|nr:S49 family peptidase [Candidatus Eisenbacteria bacterium]
MRRGGRSSGADRALVYAHVFTIGAALALALTLLAPRAEAGLEPYDEAIDPLATTPSTDDGTFGAWHNPAQWGVPEQGGFDFAIFDRGTNPSDILAWQAGFGRGVGFAVRHRDRVTVDWATPASLRSIPYYLPSPSPNGAYAYPSLTEYQIGFGGGDGRHFGGFAYHFTGPGKAAWRRSNYLSFGDIARPSRRLSIGASSRWAPSNGDADAVFDVGLRPDGTSRITLFGDLTVPNGFDFDQSTLGLGASIRPIDGVEVSARWRDNDRIQVSAGLTLARFGARATSVYRDQDQTATSPAPGGRHRLGTWYAFRGSPPNRGIDVERRAMRNRRYLAMDLHGRGVYQSYRWFDDDAKPLRDLTEQIRFAKEDPTVGGVAIRLSGFRANAAVYWELRESLLALKRSGKKVLIAADRLDQRSYYLACVADHLVLDPLGGLMMPGVQATRTYMKDLLAKLGLGFDEWRFYKYKSALETFSRTSFSDADREQFDAL